MMIWQSTVVLPTFVAVYPVGVIIDLIFENYIENCFVCDSQNANLTTQFCFAFLNEMFTKIDSLETQVTTLQARVRELETFGVDAPDGESDAELAADLHVVEEYIEGAAENEDTKFINQKHKLQQDVQKFHARDPEHDW